jgi:ribulose-5-phosphate 4-epimerase/fuculose-1-phosphate aldolase
MNISNINKKLIRLAENASKYCVGMEGNVSGKINEESFMIKASGHSLSKLKPSGLVRFNFNGEQLDNLTKKGSMELSFHTFLLSFENINYVSHTHPINCLKILCSNGSHSFANKRLFPDQVVFNGVKSCLVPYAKPGEELTEMIKSCVKSFVEEEKYFPKLILLENHGVISCGSSVNECIIITEICEKAADIFIGSASLSRPNFLTEKEINELVVDDKEKYRKSLL